MDYKDESMWLMQGDCLERMKEIPSGSVDAIICDPPFGTTYCNWDSVIPQERMWIELERVVTSTSAIVLFAQQPFTSILICSNLQLFKYTMTWEKNRCGNHMMAKYMPLKYSEDIVCFSKGGINNNTTNKMKYYPQGLAEVNRQVKGSKIKTDGINKYNRLGNDRLQKYTNYPKTIVKFDTEKNMQHPTQKPVALMEYLVKTYTNEGETVLDFTMGSGTTGVACVNTGRKFVGVEMDSHYFNVAKDRIIAASGT